MKVRSKVPGICTEHYAANKSGGLMVVSEREWTTRVRSAGN
jgi:hypothetical protein